MVAVLVVPPAEIVSENPEAKVILAAEARSFQQTLLGDLGVPQGAPPAKEETRGGLRGVRYFNWDENYPAILYTAFLLPTGPGQVRELVRVGALVRHSDCIHLGSVWEFSSLLQNLPSRPAGLVPSEVGALGRARKRAIRNVSTFRFDTVFVGAFAERARLLFDALGAETLSAQGFPVNSALSRLACKWTVSEKKVSPAVPAANVTVATPSDPKAAVPLSSPFSRGAEYPARAHRLLINRFTLAGEAKRWEAVFAWPRFLGSSTLHSGLFGEKNRLLKETTSAVDLEPIAWVQPLLPMLQINAHPLAADTFRILKRTGRWVYLDRGRAFGLEVGMHLSGPGGSQLHVIHFAPGESPQEPDVAVAIVRKDNGQTPLKPGDVVSFDPTVYPQSPARP